MSLFAMCAPHWGRLSLYLIATNINKVSESGKASFKIVLTIFGINIILVYFYEVQCNTSTQLDSTD